MTFEPIVSGSFEFDADGVPCSPRHGDRYHPRSGPEAQAREVFLAGCGLPERWRGRAAFVVLETGFGLGHNFLATLDAWRHDPARADRLVYVSIEKHPLPRAALALAHRATPWPEAAAELRGAWPPATPDLHRLAFDDGRVELLLAFGEARTWLRRLVLRPDAIFLDGFAPACNPEMWDASVCKSLGRLAAPDARLATWSAAGALRRSLVATGFEVQRAAGSHGKREITLARFAPRFAERREGPDASARSRIGDRAAASAPPSATPSPGSPDEFDVLIVGAGLAGTATAWALAAAGRHCGIVDRASGIAQEASGNPAGLFHGVVHATDGPHARFGRHAEAHLAEVVRAALAAGVPGANDGLLRLETRLDPAAMRALLARVGLPPECVEALDADEASRRAGMTIRSPAWFYPRGGWVDPVRLAHWYFERSGAGFLGGRAVAALRHEGARWVAVDATGATIAAASTVVLANAIDAEALARSVDGLHRWPLEQRRGQLAIAAAGRLVLPRIPVVGEGWLLPPVGDRAVFGATSAAGDADPAVRWADHVLNLERLETLLGRPSGLVPDELDGRTGWRCSTPDRLPLIGPVPATIVGEGERSDPKHRLVRHPGLHVFAALGSRGIATSALGARIVAAGITGDPMPVDRGLLDAIDPGRFGWRCARRRQAEPEQR